MLTTWLVRGLCRGKGALNLSSTCVWGPREVSWPEAYLPEEPRTRCRPSWQKARACEAKGQLGACHSLEGCRDELGFRVGGRGTRYWSFAQRLQG